MTSSQFVDDQADDDAISAASAAVDAAQRHYARLLCAQAARRIRREFPTACTVFFFAAPSSYREGEYAEIGSIRDHRHDLVAYGARYLGRDRLLVQEVDFDSDLTDPLATAHETGQACLLAVNDEPIETPSGETVWALDIPEALEADA